MGILKTLTSDATAIGTPVSIPDGLSVGTSYLVGVTFYTSAVADTVASGMTAGTVALTYKGFVNEYDMDIDTNNSISATAPEVEGAHASTVKSITATPAGVTGGTATHYVLRVSVLD